MDTALCPLCSKEGRLPRARFGSRWDGRQFDFLNCSGCASKFLDPLPSAGDFQRIYSQSDYHEVHYSEVSPEQFRTSLKLLRGLVRDGATALDFGCGNGQFLIAAKLGGYRSRGIELDADARSNASRVSGCEVISLAEALQAPELYDIIHLGDVLEHLPDPAKQMRELEALLLPGGLFLIQGPLEENASLVKWAAAAFRTAKSVAARSNYAATAPTHLTRTNAWSQRAFFESRLGYEVLFFEVTETGWPYMASWREIFGLNSLSTTSRGLIAKAAVAMARAANAANIQIGNRFTAVLSPNPSGQQAEVTLHGRTRREFGRPAANIGTFRFNQ